MSTKPVLLFDGVCGLCNGWVDFLLRIDRRQLFVFSPLQSRSGQSLLEQYGLPSKYTQSLVLIDNRQAYTRSSAVLRILAKLPAPWCWAALLSIIPAGFRDLVYRFIAHNRYRWFGKHDVCRLPSPAERARFLE